MKNNRTWLLLCICLCAGWLLCSLPGIKVMAADRTLTQDTVSEQTIVIESDTVYDLNGHTLSLKSGVSGSVLYVKSGATLTINDSGSAGGGKITGGNTVGGAFYEIDEYGYNRGEYVTVSDGCGGGIYVESGARLILNGGTITGNRALQGGGIFLEPGAELTVSGTVLITGNYNGASGTAKDNLWLPFGTNIIIADTLDSETKIGFTTAADPEAAEVILTDGLSGKGSHLQFVSDEGYKVIEGETGEAVLTDEPYTEEPEDPVQDPGGNGESGAGTGESGESGSGTEGSGDSGSDTGDPGNNDSSDSGEQGKNTENTSSESNRITLENNSSIELEAKITGETVKLAEISERDILKVTKGSSDSDTIVIDISHVNREITAVELTTSTVTALADVIDADDGLDSVRISMTNAAVELDSAALGAIADQAEGDTVKLVVKETTPKDLNSAQKEAIKDKEVVGTFEIYLESKGTQIHDLRGGKALVSIKLEPQTGKYSRYYHVNYLSDKGILERQLTGYINGFLRFISGHFSDYVIIYDTTVKNETDAKGIWDLTGTVPSAKELKVAINAKFKVTQKKSYIKAVWGQVEGADYYVVRLTRCGKKFSEGETFIVRNPSQTALKIKTINSKALDLTKNYKLRVEAYRNTGEGGQRIAKTITGHVVGRKNAKYANVSGIVLSKSDVTLTIGRKYKIKAGVSLVDESKSMLSDKHAAEFRYLSTDENVATVTKSGKIKAVGSGTCYVYVFAMNGYAQKIKVTVE